ncbi:unnamed protein product [Parascedosporium putredinis]|uniref:Uncharacterized protein n=1 Tax=Parascedosporium putredinis TaxID=1442378 RepID=A0A9P1GUT3_9PEZI|nr:unnamed protein product [Parascedosporium putredinis]CAI7988039.1 unnamed protein product [Parascedosporium putredinis]
MVRRVHRRNEYRFFAERLFGIRSTSGSAESNSQVSTTAVPTQSTNNGGPPRDDDLGDCLFRPNSSKCRRFRKPDSDVGHNWDVKASLWNREQAESGQLGYYPHRPRLSISRDDGFEQGKYPDRRFHGAWKFPDHCFDGLRAEHRAHKVTRSALRRRGARIYNCQQLAGAESAAQQSRGGEHDVDCKYRYHLYGLIYDEHHGVRLAQPNVKSV